MAFLHTHLLDTSRASRPTFPWRMLGSASNVVCTLFDAHLSMCIPLQVPPTPVNNQREDIPPPDRADLADLHHIDVAYQDIVDYHPQPLAVSNLHHSVDGPLLINDTRAIESCIHIS
jgi:hypothetical protein